jgi:hypothetical protein
MSSHRLRVILIFALTLSALIGVIVLVALGIHEGTGFGIVTGVLGTAVPALFDALGVERRRRDPARPAVSDDVRTTDPGAS